MIRGGFRRALQVFVSIISRVLAYVTEVHRLSVLCFYESHCVDQIFANDQ